MKGLAFVRLARTCRLAAIWAVLACPGIAAAHIESGMADNPWWAAWSADPWVLAPLALSGVLYAAGLSRLWRHAHPGAGVRGLEALAFVLGWICAFIALVSPLDAMGEQLFSAHMAQHEVLMLLAAPLMVAGRPVPVWLWALPAAWRPGIGAAGRSRAVALAWRGVSHPLSAWSVHAAVLWTWHIPPLFQAAVTDTAVHTFQHLSFFLSAAIFWWAMFDRRHGVSNALSGVLYIFTTAVHTGILGALLTFSNIVWYPVYRDTVHDWGLSAIEDQQLGGLVMWVPGGIVYLVVTIVLLMRALRQIEQRAERNRLMSRQG
jgi:putative membrane protein